MKLKRFSHSFRRAQGLAFLLPACVFLVALTACASDNEEAPAPAGTAAGTAAATPSTTGTGVAAGSPAATGTAVEGKPYGAEARAATLSPESTPGITDTEILLGAEVILSGTNGAVYSTLPGATKAYFEYINDRVPGNIVEATSNQRSRLSVSVPPGYKS